MILKVMRLVVIVMRFVNSDTIEAAKKAVARLRDEHSNITIIEDTAQQTGKHIGIEKFIKKIGFNWTGRKKGCNNYNKKKTN